VLSIEATDRRATTHEYAQRLRSHLGYQPFDEERLKHWLDERAIAGVTGAALLDGAARTLRAWKVAHGEMGALVAIRGHAASPVQSRAPLFLPPVMAEGWLLAEGWKVGLVVRACDARTAPSRGPLR
jgi:hypothetical protein